MKGLVSKTALCLMVCVWCSIVCATQTPAEPAQGTAAAATLRKAFEGVVVHPHLKPDRRFMSALGIVESFPAEQGSAPVAEFKQGKWSISYAGHELGTLPQYPDFTDAMALLKHVTKQRAGALHLGKGAASQDGLSLQAAVLDEHSLIQALMVLDSRGQKSGLTQADLGSAAEAMTRLTVLEQDYMGASDAVYAKAMALLAMAEVLGGKLMPKEESMLAYSMYYGHAEWEQIKALPEQDPWRLYVEREDDALEHAAKMNPYDLDSNYLWLRRLADLNRAQDWMTLMKKRYVSGSPPASTYATEFHMKNLETLQDASVVTPLLVLIALPGTEHLGMPSLDTAKQPAQVAEYFDKGVPYVQGAVHGPYLSGNEAVAYYRGFIYTSLSSLGVFYLDRLSSQSDAKDYHDLLGQASSASGRELFAWYDAKWRDDQGGLALPDLMTIMSSSRQINPDVYNKLWSVVTARQGGGDNFQNHAAAWQLASLYDTRTHDRLDFAETLHWINDFQDYEPALKSLADQESDRNPYAKLRLAGYEGDLKLLFEVALDKKQDKYTRILALGDVRDPRDAPELRTAYQELLLDYPDYTPAYMAYVKFLDSVEDYAEIERIAPAWLAADTDAGTGFEYQDASVAAADAELKLGHADQAWTILSRVLFEESKDPAAKPTLATYFGPVLSEGVTVALGKGDIKMAEALAHAYTTRYPDCFECQGLLLQVYWKQRRYADAANFIANWPHPIPPWQWAHNFAYVFAQAFKSDTAGGVAAFKALQQAKIKGGGLVLGYLSTGVGYTNPDLAYALRHDASESPLEVLPDILADYRYLKSRQGAQAARDWALPKLAVIHNIYAPPNSNPGAISVGAFVTYDSGVYDLYWDVTPDPDAATDPAMIWLSRAAIHVQEPVESPQQLTLLKQHFSRRQDSWHGLLGGYLMGDVKADEILDKPLDPMHMSEASYYFALRALSEHRYSDAEGWLEVDFRTQQYDNNEYRWGENLRNHWNLAYQALPVLERKGTLYEDKH